MHKIISQDERHSLPVDAEFPFEVSQEMAKIDVEELRSKGGGGFQMKQEVWPSPQSSKFKLVVNREAL